MEKKPFDIGLLHFQFHKGTIKPQTTVVKQNATKDLSIP